MRGDIAATGAGETTGGADTTGEPRVWTVS
jgi:hypothetical protein